MKGRCGTRVVHIKLGENLNCNKDKNDKIIGESEKAMLMSTRGTPIYSYYSIHEAFNTLLTNSSPIMGLRGAIAVICHHSKKGIQSKDKVIVERCEANEANYGVRTSFQIVKAKSVNW